jgi:hypothetical protein
VNCDSTLNIIVYSHIQVVGLSVWSYVTLCMENSILLKHVLMHILKKVGWRSLTLRMHVHYL